MVSWVCLLSPWVNSLKDLRNSCTVRSEVSSTLSAIFLIGRRHERSARMPSITEAVGASGCGRRVSLNRLRSAPSEASRKMSHVPRFWRARSDWNTPEN